MSFAPGQSRRLRSEESNDAALNVLSESPCLSVDSKKSRIVAILIRATVSSRYMHTTIITQNSVGGGHLLYDDINTS